MDRLYISNESRLTKCRVAGGTPIPLTEALNSPVWLEDDTIVYGGLRSLKLIAAGGGEVQTLTVTDPSTGS